MAAVKLWRRWSAVQVERAAVLAQIERQRSGPAPSVMVGRRRYTDSAELKAIPVPGWGRMDRAAGHRHRAMIASKVEELNAAQLARSLPGTLHALAWRAQRLEREAGHLAAAIRALTVLGPVDVLVRLDLIAAMWGPDGAIAEPAAPLAEVLALVDELARGRPRFQAAWRRCQRIARRGETPTAGTPR